MTRQPRFFDFVLLFVLAFCWGSSFSFIKIAVDTIPPWTITAARITLAALFILVILVIMEVPRPRQFNSFRFYLFLGLLSNALPFTFIGWGEVRIDSNLAAILLSTSPIFTALLASFLTPDEKLTAAKALGLLLGISGIITLTGPAALEKMGASIWGQLAIVAGALSYAGANVFARRSKDIHPLVNALGVLIGGAVWAIPCSLLLDKPWKLDPSFEALGSIVVLALVGTALGYIVFFRLVKVGAVFVSTGSYIVPVVGLVLGWLFLLETISWEKLLGLFLILLGVGATNFRPRRADEAEGSPAASR